MRIERNNGKTVQLNKTDVNGFTFNRTQIRFDPGFKPTMAFNTLPNYPSPICFIDQRPEEGGNSYLRTFRCFEFDNKTGQSKESNKYVINKLKKDITVGNDLSILTNVRSNRQLIAVFLTNNWVNHLFFHIEGKTITYCRINRYLFNKDVSIMFFVQIYN